MAVLGAAAMAVLRPAAPRLPCWGPPRWRRCGPLRGSSCRRPAGRHRRRRRRLSQPALRPASRDAGMLLRLLRATSPRLIEVHHTLHHPPAILDLIARLGVPYDVHIHDYPWFCPQVSLVGAERRYCGEPSVTGCEACVADCGRVIDEEIGVAGPARPLRRVPCRGASGRRAIRRRREYACAPHFPSSATHGRPAGGRRLRSPIRRARKPRDDRCRVCMLGAIGVHKGYDILLACARDAAERRSAAGVRRSRPHHRRRAPAGDRPRVHHRPVHAGRGGAADPRAGSQPGAAAVGLAGDLELRPDRAMAGRPFRGGVRFRRAGRTHPPHRPRLSVAAWECRRAESTTHWLQRSA